MITEATIVSQNLFPSRVAPHDPPHGDPLRILTARDIVQFGRSPRRWQLTEPTVDPPKVTPYELGRTLALAGEQRTHPFVRRPDSMQAMRNTCPKCESRSPAKVCLKCGVARRNVVVTVPFSGAVPECAAWVKGHEDQNRITLTGNTFDAGTEIAAACMNDPLIGQLDECSDHLVLIHGLWHDLASGLDIPVETLIDLIPRTGSQWDQCLCTIDVTQDSTPNAWALRAQYRGLHIRAALAQMLHAAATGDAREKHLWALVESGGGHMTGHRQAAAAMLHEGRSALQSLLAAYAVCVQTQVWPAFDPPPTASMDSWTEVHLEPWMIDPRQGGAGYFAVSATKTATSATTAATPPLVDAP
jgi:hypothetical protein